MGTLGATRFIIPLTAAFALSACEDGKGPNLQFLQKKPAAEAAPEVSRAAGPTTFIERDVEAPEVFQKTTDGLWDGRPSLGGVWIAHEDVKEPERVLIRNEANGKTVIGALFQRERITPGPELQMSSDAADALVAVAGAPVQLSVVALRKEKVPENPVLAAAPSEGEETVPETAKIVATSLDAPDATTEKKDPATSAEGVQVAALGGAATQKKLDVPVFDDPILGSKLPKKTGGKVEGIAATAQQAIARSSTSSAPAQPIKASARASGGLSKPFIQIGIFSVKANADNTATSLRNIGIMPTVREQTSKGKVFWRVVVGPATSGSDRSSVLKKVKELGFNDAYFVTN